MLENRIFEVENIVSDLKEEIAEKDDAMEKKNQEYDTLDNNYKNACDKGAELEGRLKKTEEQAQKDM